MPLDDAVLTCRNFKCFADLAQGFDRVQPINIIIGRNNSGKSTLLDLIEYATRPHSLIERGHRRKTPQAFVSWIVTKEMLDTLLPQEPTTLQNNNHRWSFYPRSWALDKFADRTISFDLNLQGNLSFHELQGWTDQSPGALLQRAWVLARITPKFVNPFASYEFRRITAERDVRPETNEESVDIRPNGVGLTNVVQRYINASALDRDVIEVTLLEQLNLILEPDAKYSRILIQQLGSAGSSWELYLEEPMKGRIPMSQTGSGLKTILLVLGNLLLVPLITTPPRPLAQFLFGFEELENNLHPAVQRRLFQYLRKKAVNDGCHLFITTHSNVVIDLFANDDKAQILHVKHDGEYATVAPVKTSAHGYYVLDDLDIRASDILQTNVVVWVEGPSDRFYFNRWIELWSNGDLQEGIHYQCLPFGGSVGTHLSFDDPATVEELIAALKINRHAILLVDSDRATADEELKPHVARLSSEVQSMGGYPWVTAGREVENYIPAAAYQKLLGNAELRGPAKYTNVLNYIAEKESHTTTRRKTELAHEIVSILTRDDIEATLDLANRLNAVCTFIKEKNRIITSVLGDDST